MVARRVLINLRALVIWAFVRARGGPRMMPLALAARIPALVLWLIMARSNSASAPKT